jgi:hypothetical protein
VKPAVAALQLEVEAMRAAERRSARVAAPRPADQRELHAESEARARHTDTSADAQAMDRVLEQESQREALLSDRRDCTANGSRPVGAHLTPVRALLERHKAAYNNSHPERQLPEEALMHTSGLAQQQDSNMRTSFVRSLEM